MNGIFIGRFQPFHNGHLSACKEILEQKNISKLVIAIGNPDNNTDPNFVNEPDDKMKKIIKNLRKKEKNPYTFEQRKQMISKSLQNEGIQNFKIIPFYGYYTHGKDAFGKWVDKSDSIIFLPKKDSHQSNFKKLCEECGWKIKVLEVKNNLSATKIREALKNGQDISNMVPKQVYDMTTLLHSKSVDASKIHEERKK